MKLVGKNILITGGAGFIGSHLVDALVANNRVTVVDNLSSGKLENIQHQLKKGAIDFLQADITDLEQMRKLIRANQVSFHMAVQCLRISLSDPYLVQRLRPSAKHRNQQGHLWTLESEESSPTIRGEGQRLKCSTIALFWSVGVRDVSLEVATPSMKR